MESIKMPEQYNRAEVEQKWKDYWEKEKIFEFSFDEKKPLYIVDTPPPYVSADHLHAGHIMSYAQAEFIVRYKRMRGFNVFYPMGFDDNGLPTERFVEKKYKIDKSKITKSEFIKMCLKETELGSQNYKKLWGDLGISVDWTKTYSTISPTAVKVSQWSLIDLYKKDALYRSESPVLWCPFCRTAIAQADLEDKEEDSKMNSVVFRVAGKPDLVVTTTRPELLPSCVAVYVNPENKKYRGYIGGKATVPLFDYQVPIMGSKKVREGFGTGVVMVCTWGDKEDLEKWQTDKLETRVLVTEDGRLNKLGGKFAGLKLEESRPRIIEALEENGCLLKQEDIKHTLNVHERCGTPAEFVLSKQWFIRISDLKDIWLDYGKKLKWYPQSKFKDYELWVKSIKWDWCISRQRYYGVPFPVWYCKHCDEPVFASEALLPVNPSEDKPPQKACPKCGHTHFIPEEAVMDTWATSSCTPFLLRELVQENKVRDKLFPTTLRPNAFEIIRTWDFYSIVKSHYNFGKLPFSDIMISGHGLDEHGRKISKRLGNYIPSDKLLADYGADAVRYWATGATLGQNLRFSIQEVKKGKRTVVKLWNAARLLSLGLDGLDSSDSSGCAGQPEHADVWIVGELNKTIGKVTRAFDRYTYAKAKDELDAFFWTCFADYYIEFVKYRLAGEKTDSRKAAQQTLRQVFLAILKMYAPILPFVTEEIYQNIFRASEKCRSIHLSPWPTELEIPALDIADFAAAIAAINEVRKHKTGKGLSLGAELESYILAAKVDLEKYGDFIKKVMRIGKLEAGKNNE